MPMSSAVAAFLIGEARALRERLRSIPPFDLNMPSTPAAGIGVFAKRAIDAFVEDGRGDLDARLTAYVGSLRDPAVRRAADDAAAQQELAVIRLRAGELLSRFDMFADVITQRSEYQVGVRLAGLECVAADALAVEGLEPPPVVCYLDRGSGASIRRVRTRLPGGVANPVAVIRVPRERMVGSGVGSSLVHEAGHQGAALIDLVPSVRRVLGALEPGRSGVWSLWSRWAGEVLADFWSVARVGPTAVLGLITVLSLPRPFVFRIVEDDPHPVPWIRVRLAAAIAHELYPHPQWSALDRLWRRLYPVREADPASAEILRELSRTMGALSRLIAEHRPRALAGSSLREAVSRRSLVPATLRRTYAALRSARRTAPLPPCTALACLGQARISHGLAAADERLLLDRLLTSWALHRARSETAICARRAA